MMSFSKLEKSFNVLNVRQCEDRITNLPKSLITNILSRLPTKDAVATSVLSTKWKRSWTCITNLVFDDLKLNHCTANNRTQELKKFTSFVTRVLLLRDRSYLRNMRMDLSGSYDDSLVNAWLIAALQCNIQELHLCINLKETDLLPSDIFLCRTLEFLELGLNGSYLNIPISVRLPSLKTLHLLCVQFANERSLTSLLSSCPVLEELRLCRCLGKDVRVVNIIARALKRLIIYDLPYDLREDNQIVINTPALEYFNFCDRVAQVDVIKMDHLMEAHIGSYSEGNGTEVIKDLFNGISHVEKLFIFYNSMAVISKSDPTIPKFMNLTFLEVRMAHDSGWKGLAKLLENSPRLKTLHINLVGDDKDDGPDTNIPFHDVPSCFLLHLKEIRIIRKFQKFGDEMELVEYILKNAKVLETLTLNYTTLLGSEPDADFLKSLLSLPRASNICKVVVV